MDTAQLADIRHYVEKDALALDAAIYNFHFHDGGAQKIVDELQAYQNEDGGFRGSLEHDARLPQSTAIATWTAFRIMHEAGVAADNPVLRRGLEYLVDSYDPQRTGWAIIRPEVDDYPHAPWWSYKTAMAGFGWGNPSAELLGFLIAYGGDRTADLIAALTQRALARIREVRPSDFHEVFTFQGLYRLADDSLRGRLKAPLEKLIRQAVTLDPAEWHTYCAPPLRFISSPADSFAYLFDDDVIQKNLAFMTADLTGDHWEPNWDWQGAYPDAWEQAKREWSGELTVKNLVLLKNFGAITA